MPVLRVFATSVPGGLEVKAQIIKFDEFELDVGRYELRRLGQALKLEKVPMELLILLAEREGRLVTRDEIVQRLWGPDVFVDTRQGINTAVRKVRLALKDDPDNPRILQTVFGKGYRLIPPVTTEDGEPDDRVIAGDGVAEPVAAAAPIAAADTSEASGGSATLLPIGESRSGESGREAVHPVAIRPKLARRLFLTIQVGYLALYASAFVLFPGILRLALPAFIPALILVAGLVGAATRLYLLAAVGFNYSGSSRLFHQAFAGILILDVLWAASPVLLFERLGYFTLLCVAALVFLPFSQRTLIRSAYGENPNPSWSRVQR